MRLVGPILALVTISTLELIQPIGASSDPPRPPWFTALTVTMDICLVASSGILGLTLLRRARRLMTHH